MDKDILRTEIKKQIASLNSDYINESDGAIFRSIIELPEFINAPRVFTYLSIGREVDTRFLIEYCRKIGKEVALPSDIDEGLMHFALLECDLSNLPSGKFGIPCPPQKALRLTPDNCDIIIVPALCYDEKLYRLGRGGGYFDRYLSGCAAFSVGLCRERLLVKKVPRESFDIPVNCLITEKRLARP